MSSNFNPGLTYLFKLLFFLKQKLCTYSIKTKNKNRKPATRHSKSRLAHWAKQSSFFLIARSVLALALMQSQLSLFLFMDKIKVFAVLVQSTNLSRTHTLLHLCRQLCRFQRPGHDTNHKYTALFALCVRNEASLDYQHASLCVWMRLNSDMAAIN